MKKLVFLFMCLSTYQVFAQQTLQVPASIQDAYKKETRNVSGKPGSKYWQNFGDYNIKIKFDPSTRQVSGIVDVVYFNNSPDTLKQLWFKLYPNLYKQGVVRNAKVAEADLGIGVKLTTFQVNGEQRDLGGLEVEGTNMHTNIEALAPGKSIKINIKYNYQLNKASPVRTGQVDEGAFFLAYFFPRIAVYDDVDGWNKLPYLGREEFYNDFCNFKVAIVVPKDFVVWATGDLKNPEKVLNKKFIKRIKEAEISDKVINVIDSSDLTTGNITHQKTANTWKFEAKDVTDFSFATSNHYVWRSSSLIVDSATNRRTRIDAVFNKTHEEYNEWIDFTRKTVQYMSFVFPKWPFPYSHETLFDGLDEMEYPMMVNANWVKDGSYAIGLVDHEVFHTVFPFFVGTNESKYAWMDEGWAAMGEWIISSVIDSTVIDNFGIMDYGGYSGNENDKPTITPSNLLDNNGYSFNSYTKPGLTYLYLKDYLGNKLFTGALQHYITQWHGKHPTPFDFFNSMNEGAGKNLNWIWKRWFFDGGSVDMAIKAVIKEKEGYIVQVENKGGRPLPIYLAFTYVDGSVEKLHQSFGLWEKGETVININLNTTKVLKKVEMDNVYVPDKNKKDNILILK